MASVLRTESVNFLKVDFRFPDRAKPGYAERPKRDMMSRCRTQRGAPSHSSVLEVERKPLCDGADHRALSRGDIANDVSLFVKVRVAAPFRLYEINW